MMRHDTQSGFSAIELLITLFVAAAFIAAGYQLYTVILRNSADTQQRTTANDIAYDILRRYAPQAATPCSTSPPLSPAPALPANSGLTNASLTYQFSCPYGTINVSKLTVSVKYGTPQQEVIHAIYAGTN